MFKTSTRMSPGRVLALLAILGLVAAPAAADETYVVDLNAGTARRGALFLVDPANGNRSLVSDFGNANQGPLGVHPEGLALEAAGTVLVIDTEAGTGARGALFRVDAASGVRALLSDFGNSAQGPVGVEPNGLAVEAAGTVLVIDYEAGQGNRGALFRVDAASGNRSLVSDFGNPTQGPVGLNPFGVALEAGGAVLVIDGDAETGFSGALFRIDPASGNRSLVSNFGNSAQGPLGSNPRGLAVEAAGTVLVIDRTASTGSRGALFRVNAVNGNRSLVSDFANSAQGPLGIHPNGLALEASGTVLVIDDHAGTGGNGTANGAGALFRVDRLSGRRFLVGDFGNPGQGVLGLDPEGVAVVVPNCQGRLPTVVGDDGNNVLLGSPGSDVIVGRGGADLIDGRGGNDFICGGDGNDALRGGAGNDGVEGGAGNDTLEGGPGDDRLDGGTGTDLAAGGTNTDRCQNAEVKVGCEL